MAQVDEFIKRLFGHGHPVTYGALTQNLRDKIDAVDLIEHELLERIIVVMKQNNLCLQKMSNMEVKDDDIEWP